MVWRSRLTLAHRILKSTNPCKTSFAFVQRCDQIASRHYIYTKTKMLTSQLKLITGLDFIKVLIPESIEFKLLQQNWTMYIITKDHCDQPGQNTAIKIWTPNCINFKILVGASSVTVFCFKTVSYIFYDTVLFYNEIWVYQLRLASILT
jgi:hypothetical protein